VNERYTDSAVLMATIISLVRHDHRLANIQFESTTSVVPDSQNNIIILKTNNDTGYVVAVAVYLAAGQAFCRLKASCAEYFGHLG
jgi:hypothetical protein